MLVTNNVYSKDSHENGDCKALQCAAEAPVAPGCRRGNVASLAFVVMLLENMFPSLMTLTRIVVNGDILWIYTYVSAKTYSGHWKH